MRRLAVACLFIVVFFIGYAQAEVYFWTDEKGVRHFSDTPVPGLPRVDVKKHGRIWSNSLSMRFVYLEPGTFIMGLDAKKAHYDRFAFAHKVTLTKGFQIQVTEVTNEQWKRVMPEKKSQKKQRDRTQVQDDMPVCHVSIVEAQYFVAQLNKLNDGGLYDIPTEAQWEYACRSGQTAEFNWGSDIAYPNKSNYNSGHGTMLKPVGRYAANRWHIYDMHGNVWEWCQEVSYKSGIDPKPLSHTLYESSSSGYDPNAYSNPVRTEPRMVLRGGSYVSPAYQCRSGWRIHRGQLFHGCFYGLRVIRIPLD